MELGKLVDSKLQPAKEEELCILSLVGVVPVASCLYQIRMVIVDMLRLVIIVRVENLKIAWVIKS